MSSVKLTAVLAAAASALLLCACAPVSGYENFIKSKNAKGGLYSFVIPFSDSLSTYSVSFFTRVDSPGRENLKEALRLDVTWTSPSGDTAAETVYMDASREVETYRSGISPRETGDWKVDVRVPDVPQGFRGLGIISKIDGTR